VVSSSAAIFSQAAAAAASIASPEQLDVPSTVSIAGATEKKQPAHEALDADDLAATQTHSVSMLSAEGAAASVRGFRALVRTLVGRATPDTRVDRFGRDESLVNSLQPLADLLYERYWRVTVEGANQIPNSPCIFVANHAGALPIDGPLLHHALRRQRPDLKATRWLLEDQVFHTPGLGLLWNRLGAVRASPENAHALLQEKTPIIVFPEGFQGLSKPFSERYQLRRFGRGGYVKIAVRAQVPIVPVAIVGAEDAVPLLAKLPGGLFGLPYLPITIPPLPAKWVIRFGEPVWLNAGPDAANDIDWVLQTNDRLRTHIDSMLQELLSQRSSVF
jgi:1-acyl-sn-glycerol-3-phosphate acyltransferase